MTYAGIKATKVPMKNLIMMSKGTVFANPKATVPIDARRTPEMAVGLRPIESDRYDAGARPVKIPIE